MKVFFNRVPRSEPYGGGNQFLVGMTSLLEEKGHKVAYHLEKDIDVIFMMDPRPGDIGYSLQHIAQYKHAFPKTKILHRVNECDQRKGTNEIDKLLLAGMNISEEVVFISDWLKRYFEEKGFDRKSSVVYNGCNTGHFFPQEKKSDNVRLVTHHWSDNWMKGFDLYTELDKYLSENDTDIEFEYIGRYYSGYTPKKTKIISPTFGADLGEKLRKNDIYITASRFEPCGMHHIEGTASGMPVLYHAEGGGINEFCKNHGEEFQDFNSFLNGLEKIRKNIKSYQDKIDYDFLSLDRCLNQYLSIVERMS